MQAYRTALGGEDTTLVISPDSDFFEFFGNISGLTDSRGAGRKPAQAND